MLLAPAASAYEDVCGDSCWDKKDKIPSCEDLGYTQDRYCPEGYITCPFDDSYVWCKTYSCDMSGLLTKEQADVQKAKGYLCYKSKFHGLVCYDCNEIDKTVCVYDETNKGEGRLSGTQCGDGSWTECIRTCSDKDLSASIPTVAGVVPTYRICTSCDIQETIVTGFTCEENYTKKDNTCEPNACPVPTSYTDIAYITNLTDCSSKTHPEGWKFETKGKSGDATCGRCVPKNCSLGYTAGLSSCANTAGYTYESQGFSGDEICGYCRGLNCLSPYSENYQTINDCAQMSNSDWSVAKAWDYSQDTIMAGDKACGLCQPKACVGDYSQNYQSINDCPNTSGYTWEYDKNHFYGDKYCGRCVAKSCSAGAPGLTVDQCVSSYGYSSTIGAGIVATNEYVGLEQCKTCTCDTSKLCSWTAENIGDGGEGNTVCCDGVSYTKCQKKASCDGVEATSIAHATSTTSCLACGHTYLKATACEDGYKVSSDGKSCVQKLCSDYGLVLPSECSSSQGYVATQSAEHPGCYTCEAKTCDLWGNELGQTWSLYQAASACAEGYELTDHQVMVSGALTKCFDCETCTQMSGYLTVNSLEDIPANVVEKNTIKSCNKYQYCATSCSDGYTLSGCSCVEANCNGFSQMSGLTKINDMLYTDGIFNYSTCKRGGEILYKVSGCSDGYDDIAACSQPGQIRVGSEKGGYACYRCDCGGTDATICPWNATNIGDGGAGVNVCCDGSSYQGCSRDTSKCSYTLTEEPEKASLTSSCSACGTTYYKVEACQAGYIGDTCTSCDAGNDYEMCNDDCRKKLVCAHGTLKCGSAFYCQCETGWGGSLCDTCDTENNYQPCGDTCQQALACVHGVSKCGDDGNLKCECLAGYEGTYCGICAEGYEDYGNGCVLVEDCGNGTFNNTSCVCDECYEQDSNGKCTKVKEGCTTDPVRPRTCTTEGYEDSCDESCNNCDTHTIKTLTGDRTCYSVSAKECSDFCAFWDTSSLIGSIQANSVCGSASTVLAYNYGTYSWLTSTPSSATVSACEKTCYVNDAICSAGEKLSATEKTQREANGDICSPAGMTAAGSPCYSCTSDVCPNNLVNEKDVPTKEASGYICTLKQGQTSSAGSACYECLSDVCDVGAAYSAKHVNDLLYQYGYKNDSTAYAINSSTYTGYSQTGAGHYCYTGFAPTCSSVTSNTLYNTAGDCIDAIKYHKDGNGKMLAACHACADSSSPKMIRWYPACLEGYDTKPSSNNLNYQDGNNCCVEDYVTVVENVTTPVYQWKNFVLLEYDLGGQTCYAISGQCTEALVSSAYCNGTSCSEVTCPANYKWTGDNLPDQAYVAGESCKDVSANCSESVEKYASFECDDGYSKIGDSCEIICDEAQGYYAQCPTGAKCVDSGIEGCVKFAQCDGNNGYFPPTYSLDVFTFGNLVTYYQLGGSTIQCKPVTGCASPASANRSDFDESIYSVTSVQAGNVMCYYTNGCQTGYHQVDGNCVANTCADNGTALSYEEGSCSGVQNDCATCSDYNVQTPTGTASCHRMFEKMCNKLGECSGLMPIARIGETTPSGSCVLGATCSGAKCKTYDLGEFYSDDYNVQLTVSDQYGNVCRTCYGKAQEGTVIVDPTPTCPSGTYSSQAECESGVTFATGEGCTQTDGCWERYCTQANKNQATSIATAIYNTSQSCTGSGCRTSSQCSDQSKKGSYTDGCMLDKPYATNQPGIIDPVDKKAACIEKLEYNAEFVETWNAKCTNQITLSYAWGSIERNCSNCFCTQTLTNFPIACGCIAE